MKHNKGPWNFEQLENMISIYHSGVNSTMDTERAEDGDDETDHSIAGIWSFDDVDFANARLMAAAPCLLEALQAAVNRLMFADKHIDCSDEIAAANAAIEKATKGEQK